LRLFAYNANNRTNFSEVQKVEIYFLDPTAKTAENPDGRTLVKTIGSDDVSNDDVGEYKIEFELADPLYVIGNYIDVWTVVAEELENVATIENTFQTYPDLWFTSPTPIVYDFSFSFRPNKIRKGSKRYLVVDVTANVPRASDLERYYYNLAVVSPLKIYIEQLCGDCVPSEADLRMVVEGDDIELREKNTGYYLLDTEDLEVGMYNVWFELSLGESVYLSDKNQLQIFD
jgi:hypothetical protein